MAIIEEVLGTYKIIERLAEGSEGVVYKGCTLKQARQLPLRLSKTWTPFMKLNK